MAVILHPQLADPQCTGQIGLVIQGAPAHSQRGVGGSLLHRQQLPVAPHGMVLSGRQLLLGEDRLDVVVVIDDVQNTAALAVGQVRSGFIGLAAADALAVFHVFHGDTSLYKISLYQIQSSSRKFSSATRTASTTKALKVQSVP